MNRRDESRTRTAEKTAEKRSRQVDIIDIDGWDPDLQTPAHIVEALCTAAKDPENNRYPTYASMPAYRSAVAGWYKKRFGVPLDIGTEVLALMGSQDNSLIVVSDNPYSEIAFDGYSAPSFLEIKGAMEVSIEMHALSKTYNMTGWRIGMAVGNVEILAGLGRVKTNVDSGVLNAVQHAAIAALSDPQDCVKEACATYQERRDVLVNGLSELGFDVPLPKATFYVLAAGRRLQGLCSKPAQQRRHCRNTLGRLRLSRRGVCPVCDDPPSSTDTRGTREDGRVRL